MPLEEEEIKYKFSNLNPAKSTIAQQRQIKINTTKHAQNNLLFVSNRLSARSSRLAKANKTSSVPNLA